MEDVLDVYERPYDPEYPVVCVDEPPYEMHGEARDPLPAKPGSDTKTDFEYVRCGTCSVFGAIEPLTGKCIVEARGRRTKTDLAEFLSEVSGCYPDARRIILVWDNLTLIGWDPCMRRLNLQGHGNWPQGLRCIILRNTEAGSMWPKSFSIS